MKHAIERVSACLVFGLIAAGAAQAQTTTDPDPAMNTPEKVSWQLFATVNKAATGSNVLFETWASNEDTFQSNPVFPGTSGPPHCAPERVLVAAERQPVTPLASPKILNVPRLVAEAPRVPGLQPHITEGGSEEVRRNQVAFDFIVCSKLQTMAGLRVAFAAGTPISFPVEAVEVKANWVPAGNRSPDQFHINTDSTGQRFALVSMHIISKAVPNWTWATFEQESNPGRCDFIGCHDDFGAVVKNVAPHAQPGGSYSACVKTPALKKLLSDAGLPPMWEHYCLKGSQVDFVTATGLPTHLGNSVTENGFVNTSSCMTCHSRAAVNAQAQPTSQAGFLVPPPPALCPTGSPCSPNGTPVPSWFWNNPGQPNQSPLAMQTDFVWSIPFNAIGP